MTSAHPPASSGGHAAHDSATQGPVTRPNMTVVGTVVWLGSEVMFFAGLFAIYFTHRSVSPELWAERTAELNVPFALINTSILVISSLWCQFGVFAAENHRPVRTGSLLNLRLWGMREWYTLTYIFGAVFVAGQIWEYAELAQHGLLISSDPYGSAFYMATGFHGLHVAGGLIAFLLIIGRTYTARRYTKAQESGAIVTAYYWHFVDVVWIGLFGVIYLLQ